MSVKVFNFGYDPYTGVGELVVTVSYNHALTMVHRGVAEPADFTLVGDRLVILSLTLTRYIYCGWTSRDGRIGFSFRAVHDRDGWRCGYCGVDVERTPQHVNTMATVDHIVPKSAGGESSWLNLITACYKCNSEKADLPLADSGKTLLWVPSIPENARDC